MTWASSAPQSTLSKGYTLYSSQKLSEAYVKRFTAPHNLEQSQSADQNIMEFLVFLLVLFLTAYSTVTNSKRWILRHRESNFVSLFCMLFVVSFVMSLWEANSRRDGKQNLFFLFSFGSSLPHPQQPSISSYLLPDEFTRHFVKFVFNSIYHSTSGNRGMEKIT